MITLPANCLVGRVLGDYANQIRLTKCLVYGIIAEVDFDPGNFTGLLTSQAPDRIC